MNVKEEDSHPAISNFSKAQKIEFIVGESKETRLEGEIKNEIPSQWYQTIVAQQEPLFRSVKIQCGGVRKFV